MNSVLILRNYSSPPNRFSWLVLLINWQTRVTSTAQIADTIGEQKEDVSAVKLHNFPRVHGRTFQLVQFKMGNGTESKQSFTICLRNYFSFSFATELIVNWVKPFAFCENDNEGSARRNLPFVVLIIQKAAVESAKSGMKRERTNYYRILFPAQTKRQTHDFKINTLSTNETEVLLKTDNCFKVCVFVVCTFCTFLGWGWWNFIWWDFL